VEEVTYQLEESLQLLELAEPLLVDCCVPLVASPESRDLLSFHPLHWPGVGPLKGDAEVYLPMDY